VRHKNEAEHTVQGLHEAIISETLFYKVQDILNGKERIENKVHSPDMLPLCGFLKCSKCSRTLCGSTSKGLKGYSSACSCCYKAEEVNTVFTDQLAGYEVKDKLTTLSSTVITDIYYKQFGNQTDNHLNERLSKARELLLCGELDGSDYKEIKAETESKREVLESQLAELIGNKKAIERIEPLLDRSMDKLTRLNALYSQSGTSEKRELIGSMYPQKFTFEELQH